MLKRYDVVFLNKRGLFGKETVDTTLNLNKNTLYNISNVQNDYVLLHNMGQWHHQDHFIKPESDTVCGINIFSAGDKVIFLEHSDIGWEILGRTKSYMLIVGKEYTVTEYVISTPVCTFVRLNDGNAYHPNHFKKV